ncbi:hypothetical protein [Paramagnetospirillum caucaseum]|uniref:hypothetical protein n=1 Tax=Paramagnetospirillum caucaseum TaxID=1244869 RepID=UPI000347A0E9|nr:hypothetical protein [Paramagnetospirillum caucaseum]
MNAANLSFGVEAGSLSRCVLPLRPIPLGGLLIHSGLDKVVETRLADTMPPWLVNLTARF